MNLGKEDKEFLALYSDSKYEKPSLTVDSVIFRIADEDVGNYRKLPQKKLQVLLTKRNWSPFLGAYALPGTFVDLENDLTSTMKLCVKNKVGLENFYYEQLFTFGDKGRDPRTRVFSVGYLLLTNEKEIINNGEWFNVEIEKGSSERTKTKNGYEQSQIFTIVLESSQNKFVSTLKISQKKENLEETKSIEILSSPIAFDHIKMIFFAHERLKNKIEYTDIAFNMLPSLFTLTELKQVYELILDEKLLDANFRRKTTKMVQATNEYVTGKGHRSSQLFSLNPNWKTTNLD